VTLGTYTNIATEFHAGFIEKAFELLRDRFGSLVIGRHTIADQSERRRTLVENIDATFRQGPPQSLSGKAARRPASNDRDPRFRFARSISIMRIPGALPCDRKLSHSAENPAGCGWRIIINQAHATETAEQCRQTDLGYFGFRDPGAKASVNALT
ncbi:hypothetical protein LB823_23590, partial [Tsukamurella sp. M9C]